MRFNRLNNQPAVLFAALLTVAMLSPAPLLAADADRPNIIFFLADDQKADAMGCAGHPIIKTPTMDRLAKEGVRFTNAFVTTSICAASRASILTGLYERTHRFTFGTPPISEPHTDASYPAVLRAAGYRTGFTGKFGVGVRKGAREKMFDVFKPVNRSPYFRKAPDGTIKHASEIAGDHAVAFLQSQPKDKPFCLSVSFNAPHAEDSDKENHYPYPKAMEGLYDDVTVPSPRLATDAIFNSQPEYLRKGMNRDRWFWRWDTPEKYQKNIKGYYRMISGIDNVMGRVLKEVEKLGLAKNTVVIFTGDNGYYAGQRQFAGKWSHYEESLRVPMIIFDPRFTKPLRGREVEAMALNIDLAPTMLDLAGVDIPSHYQGRSLMVLARGGKPADWRTDFFCEHLMDHRKIPKWEGVRAQRFKYARYFEQDKDAELLHDLKNDPDELRNLVGDPAYAKALEEMRTRCDELRDAYGGKYKPHEKK